MTENIVSSFPVDKKLSYEDLMKVTKEIISIDSIKLEKGRYVIFQQVSNYPNFLSAIEIVPEDSLQSRVLFLLNLSKGVAYVGVEGLPLILQSEDLQTVNTSVEMALFDYDSNKSIQELLSSNIKFWALAPASFEAEFSDGSKYLNLKELRVTEWEN